MIIRRIMPFDEWPAIDCQLWEMATDTRDFFADSVGRPAYWREPTKQKNQKQYGRWLTFLAATGRFDPDQHPCDRTTRENVRAYVTMLQGQVTPWTVWSYTVGLHQMMRAFDPARDWTWLYNITGRLEARRRPTRQKHSRLLPASQIDRWARQELNRFDAEGVFNLSTALAYRNHLLILFLVHCPVRVRNLCMIEIDRHLRRGSDGYRLLFEPEEVKNNRYLTMDLGDTLTAYIDRWLTVWRSILLTGEDHGYLWVGIKGHPFRERGVHKAITELTEDALGKPINPHLFRDIAATSIADEDPTHIGIAGSILGHLNPQTTEKHYIHASQIDAGRRHRSVIHSLRAALADDPSIRRNRKSK